MTTTTEIPEGYTTPAVLGFGWLLFCFTLIPMLLGFTDGKPVLLIVGSIGLAVSLMLIFLGSAQRKKVIANLQKEKQTPSV